MDPDDTTDDTDKAEDYLNKELEKDKQAINERFYKRTMADTAVVDTAEYFPENNQQQGCAPCLPPPPPPPPPGPANASSQARRRLFSPTPTPTPTPTPNINPTPTLPHNPYPYRPIRRPPRGRPIHGAGRGG